MWSLRDGVQWAYLNNDAGIEGFRFTAWFRAEPLTGCVPNDVPSKTEGSQGCHYDVELNLKLHRTQERSNVAVIGEHIAGVPTYRFIQLTLVVRVTVGNLVCKYIFGIVLHTGDSIVCNCGKRTVRQFIFTLLRLGFGIQALRRKGLISHHQRIQQQCLFLLASMLLSS